MEIFVAQGAINKEFEKVHKSLKKETKLNRE